MTAISPAIPRTGKRNDRLPSTVRLGLASGVLELKAFFRRWERVGFTFALPVVLLIIFGAIFSGKISGTSVNYREYFTTGIIAVGIATTTFVNLGISINTIRLYMRSIYESSRCIRNPKPLPGVRVNAGHAPL